METFFSKGLNLLTFCPLASGSSGNAIYLGTDQLRLLFDAGISCKALEDRLCQIGVGIKEIDAVIISHEHLDHIAGLKKLIKDHNPLLFCNSETAKALCRLWEGERPRFKIFTTGERFNFCDVEIHPFTVQHDAIDPVAFTVQIGGVKIAICTDLGISTSLVVHHLQNCDLIYLEANHDEEMVKISSRPEDYKRRILGRQGHLSNRASADLLARVAHPDLRQIYLAHLSQQCNCPDLALETVASIWHDERDRPQLSIAPPDTIGDLLVWPIS